MKRAVFRYVEAELFDYHHTRRELEDLRLAIMEEGPDPGLVVMDSRARPPSDSTYEKTARLLTNRRLRKMEETVRAVDRVVERLPADRQRLVELKYFRGRLSNLGVADELNVSLRTFYRWRDEVVVAVAVEMGLVNAVDVNGRAS